MRDMCIYTYVCVYTYMYMYVFLPVYIYIYMHIRRNVITYMSIQMDVSQMLHCGMINFLQSLTAPPLRNHGSCYTYSRDKGV